MTCLQELVQQRHIQQPKALRLAYQDAPTFFALGISSHASSAIGGIRVVARSTTAASRQRRHQQGLLVVQLSTTARRALRHGLVRVAFATRRSRARRIILRRLLHAAAVTEIGPQHLRPLRRLGHGTVEHALRHHHCASVARGPPARHAVRIDNRDN